MGSESDGIIKVVGVLEFRNHTCTKPCLLERLSIVALAS